ncbi:MAG: MFS transporter [Acidimicrobiia bacterium]
MSVTAFVVGYGASVISATLPYARVAMDLSEGAMFWIFGITRALSLAGILFAFTADRQGRRDAFLVAFALIPVGNLLAGLLPTPVTFTIAQGITRIGVVGVAALAVVILAEELTPAVRALGIGIYAIAGSVGAGLGLLLLPIADGGDNRWRILFGLTALGLLALPLLNRFLEESRAFLRPSPRVGYAAVMESNEGRYLWTLAGIAFLVALFSSPAFNFVLERLVNDLEWTSRSATMLLVVASGVGTVGLLVGGRLADISGRRQVAGLGIIIGLIGGVGVYFVDTPVLLGVTIFLGTLGATMLTPAFAAHRSELFPTRVRASAAGLITNAGIVGSILGFVIGALVVDSIGLSRTIAFLGIGLLAAVWLVFQLPETKGRVLVERGGEAHPADGTGDHARVDELNPR